MTMGVAPWRRFRVRRVGTVTGLGVAVAGSGEAVGLDVGETVGLDAESGFGAA
jgi:hypothetical protein